MKKKLKWVVWGLVGVVVVGLVVVYINLNSIVRRGVETAATQSLGLQTTLGAATVSLFGGSVGLHEFAVASPAGFDAASFLEVGDLKLQVSASELRETPIRVSSITLNQPRLVVEQKGMKLNLSAVQEALPKTDPNAPPPPKLVIGEVKVVGATVVLRPGFPGLVEEIVVVLPAIVVKDIGTADSAQNGVAIKEALVTVATAMAEKALEDGKIPPELRALLKGDLAGLKAQFGREVEKLQGELKKKVGQEVEKAKGEAQKAIEDFKKKNGLGDLPKKP